MRIFLFFTTIIAIISFNSCRSYSPVIGRLFYSNDSLIHLNNVQYFINNSSNPFDTLQIDFHKEWSNNRDFYLSHKYEAIDNYEGIGVSYLYNKNNELISIIEGTNPGSGYIWLDNYLLITCESYYWSISLQTGKKKFIRRKGKYRYLGKSENDFYFEALEAKSKIKCKKVKNKGAIIRLNNGRPSYVIKEPADSIINLYYSPDISVSYKKDQDFYILNKSGIAKEIAYEKMFYPGQIYNIGDTIAYFIANDIELYKLTNDSIIKLIVFNQVAKGLKDISYKVKNNYLIIKAFSKTKLNESNMSLLYPDNRYLTFAFINLENKEVFYPFIKQ